MKFLTLVRTSIPLFLAAFFVFSCSKSEKKAEPQSVAEPQQVNAAQYQSWEVFRHNKIQILHPKDHHLAYSFPEMADWYEKHIPPICNYLGLPAYADTLRIYYYTGYGQGEAMTGRGYPFATPNVIHFWLPSTYGPPLVEFLLQQWKLGNQEQKFLKEGLKTLFDYSGKNYYAVARYYQSKDSALSLRQLIEDPHISADSERFQSVFAATFVDFIGFNYGPAKLKALYFSNDDFADALEATLGFDVDSAEILWQRFIQESFPDARYNPSDTNKIIDVPLH